MIIVIFLKKYYVDISKGEYQKWFMDLYTRLVYGNSVGSLDKTEHMCGIIVE